MEDEDHTLLMVMYESWRRHQVSMTTVEDLSKRMRDLGFSTDVKESLARLVAEHFVDQHGVWIMLTEKGLVKGLRIDGL
ncbi:hypothetical protein G3545_19885 [Starkeya sp. ORNL1]|uniref:hypothetical protein n=1 Tax=Starkeya sp. ORNL1 TaxID=2709380 RepID=UPI001462B66C|nr:hypothetical protein [Starkeya sp. ORNL1]QJP15715.1 hypothetical protein G3545_19885 [Starkeya sp. ORNL1]